MFWFARYRFSYPAHATSACERLTATLQKEKWKRITCKVANERVKLQHKQPAFFHNYWSPIFDGRFIVEGSNRYLVGYFRPDWLLFLLNLLTFALAGSQLVAMLLEPSGHAIRSEDWPPKELHWQVSIFGALVFLMLFGWCIGIPHERRILTAIHESTASALNDQVDQR